MSYRELTMMDVKEVLRRWQAEQSARQIARETRIDRKTVGRYIATAEQLALARDRALSDSEVHAVAQRQQARPSLDPSAEWKAITQHHARIEAWLGGARPLRLQKIHILLKREGLEASYATLRRYVIEELGWHKPEPTVLLDDPPPGQEAQIDFGKMGLRFDAETERRRVLWALIITLSFSRYMFVWPTFLQTTAAVCEGLDRAFGFFGAMPRTLIPDNTKAMITEPDALCPRLTEAFADYVQARGLFVDPARVRSPKDKPRVENQVAYVRENWFDGETFTDLEDARRSAEHWSHAIAGARVHGTTRRVPREQFEQSGICSCSASPTRSRVATAPLRRTARARRASIRRCTWSTSTRPRR